MSKSLYNHVVASRVDDATIEYLNKLEEESGLHQTAIVRMMIENARNNEAIQLTSRTDYQSMKELIREVNKIGININQITKSVNEHFYTMYEKKKLFAMMQSMNEMLAKQFGFDME